VLELPGHAEEVDESLEEQSAVESSSQMCALDAEVWPSSLLEPETPDEVWPSSSLEVQESPVSLEDRSKSPWRANMMESAPSCLRGVVGG
jgi:hypothetical protein